MVSVEVRGQVTGVLSFHMRDGGAGTQVSLGGKCPCLLCYLARFQASTLSSHKSVKVKFPLKKFPWKLGMASWVYEPSAAPAQWKIEESSGGAQASVSCAQWQIRHRLKQGRRWRLTPNTLLWPPHACCVPICMHAHTHTHVHKYFLKKRERK